MKAVRMHGYGGPEVLKLATVPVPSAGPGEPTSEGPPA